jgi:1-acyl-sn-glycerol-3-phosphate acyltransferase
MIGGKVQTNDEQLVRVGDPGWTYDFFRKLFGRSLKVFFRKIEVEGAENVPASGGGILIAWHPNAVVDGMLSSASNKISLFLSCSLADI